MKLVGKNNLIRLVLSNVSGKVGADSNYSVLQSACFFNVCRAVSFKIEWKSKNTNNMISRRAYKYNS